MRISLLLLSVVVLSTSLSSAASNKIRPVSLQGEPTVRALDINRLNLRITDRGNLVTNFSGGGGNSWWYTDTTYDAVAYDQGPWIIGKTDNGLVMGNAYWGTSYMPGPSQARAHEMSEAGFHPVMTWSRLGSDSALARTRPGHRFS